MDTIKAKGDYHRFLIGRGGANIRKVPDLEKNISLQTM